MRVRSDLETRIDALFPALTVELGLYVVLVLAAWVTRFLLLGYAPLSAGEAQQALASWNFVTGGEASITGSPLLYTVNAALFALLGASDMVARLVPAVFGTVLVLLPALLRRELGRAGALVGAFLLAFSPSVVFFSRNLDGAIIAVTCGLAASAFAWRYVTERSGRAGNLAAVSAALALIAGREVWTLVLALVVFTAVCLTRLKDVFAAERGDSADGPERIEPGQFLRKDFIRGSVLFGSVFFLVSTAFLFHLNGLGAVFDLFGTWLASLRPSLSFFDPLLLLVVYEPVSLVFGLMGLSGLAFMFRSAERDQLPLVALGTWFIVGIILYSIGSDKTPSRVVALMVPLALIAGWFVGGWITRLTEELGDVPDARAILVAQEGPVLAFTCLLAVFIYFVLAEYATRGTVLAADLLAALFGGGRGSAGAAFNGAVLTALIAVAVAAVAFLAVTTVGWGRARNIAISALLILGTAWTFRQMVLVSFSQTLNSREWLVSRATSPNVRDLVSDLEDVSRWRANDSYTISVLADDNLGPVVRWNLRGFRNVRYEARPAMSQGIQALILPAGAPVNSDKLMSQYYRLQTSQSAAPQQNLLRWLIFRDSGNLDFSDAVLWIQQPD
jgi:uncharacterized protein (TIGR03663 family)